MSVSDVMDFKYKKQLQQDEEISLYERFQRCKMPFKTEDVKAAKQNVELGDHLAVHRALFILHFICTGIEEDKITLHTVDPVCDACRGIRINCSNLHEVTTREFHTYQEMEEENMFKIIWPDELKSRSRDVQRIISSAKEIIHEIDSEIFVTRCIYGVGVRLKVEQTYFYMEDALKTIHVLLKEILKEKSAKNAQEKLYHKVSNSHDDDVDNSNMASSSSIVIVNKEDLFNSFSDLEYISQMSPYDQKRWLLHIFGESLCSYKEFSKISEIAKGDHIIFEREYLDGKVRYYHSALVTDVVDENNITLIEYSNPSQLKCTMGMLDIAMITERTKSLEKLKSEGAKKVEWHEKITLLCNEPDKVVSRARERLAENACNSAKNNCEEHFEAEKVTSPREPKPFTPDDVKKRAKSRLGENAYDLIKNNCEHFVTWCKFGLTVSLQVEDWVILTRITFYTAVAAFKVPTIKGFLQVLENVSDDIAVFTESFKNSPNSLPRIAGVLFEVLLAFYQTYALNCLSQKKVITDKQWKAEIREIWLKGSCRAIGGYAGSALGGIIGGMIGAGLGHLMGSLYEWFRQDSEIRRRVEAWISEIKAEISKSVLSPDEKSCSSASLQSFQALLFDSDCMNMKKHSKENPEECLKPVSLLLQSAGVL